MLLLQTPPESMFVAVFVGRIPLTFPAVPTYSVPPPEDKSLLHTPITSQTISPVIVKIVCCPTAPVVAATKVQTDSILNVSLVVIICLLLSRSCAALNFVILKSSFQAGVTTKTFAVELKGRQSR